MSAESLGTADTLAGGARTGQLLAGKYRLIRLLGRGGMGEVYEARHEVVGRRFAVKFLHAVPQLGSGAAQRFLREAQAAGALESPHIAAVLDYDAAPDGAPFLVMEFLSGESLSRVLRREGRLSAPRVVGLLLQACAGLAVAHRAGIVHRDLKPDNLFVVERPDGSELLKLVDFGIAKLTGEGASADVTQSGAVLGTPYYMAPEQARGERKLDRRVDVHALGVIAYELLSGRKPHPGDSYNAILAHVLTEPVQPLGELCPELPAALVATIERAMAFEPSRRHSSVEELAAELGAVAGRELKLRGEALDLAAQRDELRIHPELCTAAETSAGGETPGTLQTAVGEVRASAAPSKGRALLAAALVVAIGSAGAWTLSRRAARSAAEASTLALPGGARSEAAAQPATSGAVPRPAVPPDSATSSSAPVPVESAVQVAAPAASASATSSGARALPRAALRRAKEHPAVTATSPHPAAPPAASFGREPPPVSFDERNPY